MVPRSVSFLRERFLKESPSNLGPIIIILFFASTAIGLGVIVSDSDLGAIHFGLAAPPAWEMDLQISTLYDYQLHPFDMDRITSYWLWASGMGPPPPIHEVGADSGGASGSGWLGGLVDWVADIWLEGVGA